MACRKYKSRAPHTYTAGIPAWKSSHACARKCTSFFREAEKKRNDIATGHRWRSGKSAAGSGREKPDSPPRVVRYSLPLGRWGYMCAGGGRRLLERHRINSSRVFYFSSERLFFFFFFSFSSSVVAFFLLVRGQDAASSRPAIFFIAALKVFQIDATRSANKLFHGASL